MDVLFDSIKILLHSVAFSYEKGTHRGRIKIEKEQTEVQANH